MEDIRVDDDDDNILCFGGGVVRGQLRGIKRNEEPAPRLVVYWIMPERRSLEWFQTQAMNDLRE